MIGRHRLSFVLIAVALSACASATMVLPPPPAQLPANNDEKIVPGQRVGNLVIGMSTKQVFQLLGDPSFTGDAARGFSYGYTAMKLSAVTYEATQQIEEADTSDPDYSTAEGVHVGGTLLSLRANYGEPEKIIPGGPTGTEWSIYCYEKLGLYAWLDQGAKITNLGVFRPGNYCWGTER